MNSIDIMNTLSALMRLQLQKKPSIEINTKSAPRRLIGQLVRKKYIPSYQSAPDNLKWLVKGEGDCEPDTSIHIIDLLGVYDSRENKIILYDLLIKLCSAQLELDYEGLYSIVLMHELSHAITHRGTDSDNQIWEYFDIATSDIKEYFAQIYTYKQIQLDNNVLLISIMNKLSKAQTDVYQSYKNAIESPVEKINQELLKARRSVPDGFETYPKAVDSRWEIVFNNLQKYREPDMRIYFMEARLFGYPPTPPAGKLITTGTEFRITANKIKIRSYDYSPSSDELPAESTCELYNLIFKHEAAIEQKTISKKTGIPFFSISFGDKEYHLDLKDFFVVGLWKQIVAIIDKTYPVLGKVLRGYENDFK